MSGCHKLPKVPKASCTTRVAWCLFYCGPVLCYLGDIHEGGNYMGWSQDISFLKYAPPYSTFIS